MRTKYDLEDALFSTTGNVVFADYHAVLLFCDKVNRDRPDHEKLSPADVNAGALLDEMVHHAIAHYRATVDPSVIERTLADLVEEFGSVAVDGILADFLELFPTTDIYKNRVSIESYLEGSTDDIPNRAIALEEVLVSRLANENPAYQPLRSLVGDDELRASPLYPTVMSAFSKPPPPTEEGSQRKESLVEVLRMPWRHAPYSLLAQLTFVRDRWSISLSPIATDRLTMGTGIISEEHRALEMMTFAGGGPGPVVAPSFHDEPEEENFSPDVDWMPHVIMVAKNALVWLNQLSKRYDRPIRFLNEVPDEEIAQLARRGFNALWLIGVWERSAASSRLKQWTGNPDAAASAYSLFDYTIAEELGGEEALRQFGAACRRHGIRLASDMVPNHTGLDSRWVREHPDWFVQLPHPPYPGYRYTSESLGDPEAPILQVENGYFDRSDAAVTFRRVDRTTGDERFIYHGNDGTGMPWNDTAQLDFTRADVREAVIQTILHVARLFPIIRFDAAMVLTKKHFHRLWYPEPGSGEGVPSRAAYGLKRGAFDRRMPNEFWREVVDRVATEEPDTLLLAEAFWLLEGYFVRTLGMHRVYNSAFMHMLKKEDNREYRDVIRKTVAFEPEVLKRYVNFMSNPDEETAIEQFGDGDKYFGVCTLMQTLPGLPMWGHGQVEGLTEKYGMEYRRAYLDEPQRSDLMERHERQIVPLMRKRHLFAEAKHFRLLDFEVSPGQVNENVYVFTNRTNTEQAVVLYNNRFESTTGFVRMQAVADDHPAAPESLLEALNLHVEKGEVVTCRDMVSGLTFLETAERLRARGLRVRLRGYEARVLTDFVVVRDANAGALAELALHLDGSGVESPDEASRDVRLRPLVDVLAPIARAALSGQPQPELNPDDLATGDLVKLDTSDLQTLVDTLFDELSSVQKLSSLGERVQWNRSTRYRAALKLLASSLADGSPARAIVIGDAVLRSLELIDVEDRLAVSQSLLKRIGVATGKSAAGAVQVAACVGSLALTRASKRRPIETLGRLASLKEAAAALNVHEFAGTTYFNKERFELLSAAVFCLGASIEDAHEKRQTARRISEHYDAYRKMIDLMGKSDYNGTDFGKRIRRFRPRKKSLKNKASNGKTNT